MIKKTFLLLLLVVTAVTVRAQGVLEVDDLSQANAVYSSEGEKAAVEIRCNHTIPLQFSSTMDKSVDLFSTEIQGTDSVYFIEFPAGARYRGRVLTVVAPGFNPLDIPLDLEPKQLRTFKIYDPNSMVDAGCYLDMDEDALKEEQCQHRQGGFADQVAQRCRHPVSYARLQCGGRDL